MIKLDDILSQVKQIADKQLKEENVSSIDPRILSLKKGVKYKGRFVPKLAKDDENDASETIVTFEEVGFTSRADGSYVFAGRSPKNAGISPKNDILNQTQWDAYTKAKARNDKPEMDLACKLIPKRKQLINFYLHSVEGEDDAAKSKIGKVVALRYPAQLNKEKQPSSEIYKKINEGLYGEKAAKIGTRAFDLSPKGRSFEIKVDTKGEWADYSASFDDAEDLGLTPAEIKNIVASAHDLKDFVPQVKTEAELKAILDEHWFVKTASKEDELDDELDDSKSDNIDKLLSDINDDGDDDLNFG